MPEFAEFLIEQSKAVGGMIWTRGLRPMAGIAARGAAEIAAREAEIEKKKAEKMGKKWEELSLGEKLKVSKGMAPLTWAIRKGHQAFGVTPEFIAAKKIEEEAEKLEKAYGKDTKTAMIAGLLYGWRGADQHTKSAMALYLAKMFGDDEKGLGRLSGAQLKEATEITAALAPHRVEDIVKHRQSLIEGKITPKDAPDERLADLISRAMAAKGTEKDEYGMFKDKDLQLMVDLGIKIDNQPIEKLATSLEPGERKKAIRKVLHKKAIDALKAPDIETLTRETMKDSEFQEAAARWMDWSLTRRMGEKNPAILPEIQDKIKDITLPEIARSNTKILRAPYTPAGMLAGLSPWENMPDKTKIDEKIRDWRKEMKKEREEEREARERAAPPPPPSPRVERLRKREEEERRKMKERIERIKKRGEK